MTNNDEQLNNATAEPVVTANEQTADLPTAEEPAVEQANTYVRRKRVDRALNVAIWVAIAVLIVLVILRLFVFTNIRIVGESMSDTYNAGDVVTVNKTAAIKRGAVAVFYSKDVDNKFLAMFASPEDSAEGRKYEKYNKRVVEVAGDKLWVERADGNDMYRVVIETPDGTQLREDYYKRGKTVVSERLICNDSAVAVTGIGKVLSETSRDNPFVVSEGHFFAMGDNRLNSYDSRSFGEIPVSRLFGIVIN